MSLLILAIFFFSSRRRHTRFDCDWSFRRVLFRSSLGAAAVVAHHTFGGAELAFAHRPAPDTRLALALATGTVAGHAAARAQLTLQLLVNSAARSGAEIGRASCRERV